MHACLAWLARPPCLDAGSSPVRLNVYDVGRTGIVQQFNHVSVVWLGQSGLFHVAVEVYGREWSFGKTAVPTDTGIFCCEPRANPDHNYRCTVELQPTSLSRAAIEARLRMTSDTWVGGKYDLLRKNCVHFCEQMALMLAAGPLPQWVMKSSKAAAEMDSASAGAVGVAAGALGLQSAVSQARAAQRSRAKQPGMTVKRAASFDLPRRQSRDPGDEHSPVNIAASAGRAIVRQLSFDRILDAGKRRTGSRRAGSGSENDLIVDPREKRTDQL